jgi:Cytochrome c7 and related cytochrome c
VKRIEEILRSFVVVTFGFAVLFLVAPFQTFQAQTSETRAVNQDVHNTPVPSAPPVQPLPYSHKTHLALGLQCQGCHTNPDATGLMTFPDTATCMTCHASVAKNKPSIQKLAGYAKSKTAVPWVRVYTVLPGTSWNHRKHLEAGMKCEMCHGDVSQMELMTNVKSVTSMDGCIDCHKLHQAKSTCVTCHAAWAPGMVVVKQ